MRLREAGFPFEQIPASSLLPAKAALGPQRVRVFLYWMLIAFLIIFPKSGLKTDGVPLTTGYAVIGVTALLGLADNLLHGRSDLSGFIALGLSGPFGAIVMLSLIMNGAVDPGSALAATTSFLVLPAIFFGLFSCQLPAIPWTTIRRSIILSIRIVAAFGLFLFLIKLVTGTFIEIPYLTVNADDAGLIEKTKYIDRGGIYKLISTYGNGNVLGASMLLLLPLYLWLERSRVFIAIVVAALILTLSRTVWLGLLVACLLTLLQRKITSGLLIGLAVGVASFILIALFIATSISNGTGFLLDPTLGGRSYTLEQMTNITLLPSAPVDMLAEIVYAGVIQQFGVLGLLTFVIFLLAPVIVAKMRHGDLLWVQKKAILGIYTYAFICSGDGAIMLIPVIPIYLFVSIILLEAPRLAPGKVDFLSLQRGAVASGR